MLIIIGIVYCIGFIISFLMLKTEHVAEGNSYTIGNRLLSFLFSLLSFAMVLLLLMVAWYKYIKLTGFWDKPVNNKM